MFTLPSRSAVPVERTWDTTNIFASDVEWEAACVELDTLLPGLAGFSGRLSDNPATLADYFVAEEQTARLVSKIGVYAGLFFYTDADDQAAGAMMGRARSLYAKVGAAVAFAETEIMEIGFGTLRQWQAKEPRLTDFAHYFERLENRAEHVRSGEVEQVMAMASDPFGTAAATYGILVNSDLQFAAAHNSAGDELEVGQSSITKLITDPDRATRRSAWESYADGYLSVKNTVANTLITSLKQDAFRARVRGYDSTLDASLSSEKIPAAVFHNLLDVFQANLPTWHRYWAIRKKAMGVDELHEFDLAAPLTPNKPLVPYEQAVEWIAEGMLPLGKDYVSILRSGALADRWVDSAVNKGKRAGAFSYGTPGTHPFIMMSNADDLFSMSTLAHELGHSMHSYLTWQTQPFVYADYSLFVAEVASNFNQALVRARLFETQTDPDFQIALIEEAMANFHRYFFIMPTLARVELAAHEGVWQGESPSADELIGLTADLFAEGYGDIVVFDRKRIGITWSQFGHLYSNFYVYQYATGISGAHALAEPILAGDSHAVDRYLHFLRVGGSAYPLDALKQAGVDLTTPGPVETTFKALEGLVDRLEKLLEG